MHSSESASLEAWEKRSQCWKAYHDSICQLEGGQLDESVDTCRRLRGSLHLHWGFAGAREWHACTDTPLALAAWHGMAELEVLCSKSCLRSATD